MLITLQSHNTIPIQDAIKQLQEDTDNAILIWTTPNTNILRFIKHSSFSEKSFYWVSPFCASGQDNAGMSILTFEELRLFMQTQIVHGDEFHLFFNEEGFKLWLKEKYCKEEAK